MSSRKRYFTYQLLWLVGLVLPCSAAIVSGPPSASKNGFEEILQSGENALTSDLPQAIIYLENARKLRPENIEAVMLLAKAYALNGEFSRALEIYNGLLPHRPDSIWLLYNMAETLSWSGDYSQAEVYYRKILAIEPQNEGAQIGLATLEFWQGDLAEAEARFQAVKSSHGRLVAPLLGLGDLFLSQRAWTTAEKYYGQALLLEPGNPSAHDRLQDLNRLRSTKFQFSFEKFTDNSGFGQSSWGGSLVKFPWPERLFTNLGYRRRTFTQRHAREVQRNEVSLSLDSQIWPRGNWIATYTGYFDEVGNEASQGGVLHGMEILGTHQFGYRSNLYFSGAHVLVTDSILAVQHQLTANLAGVGLDVYLGANCSAGGNWSWARYSDENLRQEREAQFLWQLAKKPEIRLQAKYKYLDFSNPGSAFYQPEREEAAWYWAPGHYETYTWLPQITLALAPEWLLDLKGQGQYIVQEQAWGWGADSRLSYGGFADLVVFAAIDYFYAQVSTPWSGVHILLGVQVACNEVK